MEDTNLNVNNISKYAYNLAKLYIGALARVNRFDLIK